MNLLWGLLNRRPETSLAQFSQHWRTIHKEHALKLVPPGYMRGYVQNHRIDLDVPGLEVAADGMPEVWVDNMDAVEALRESPEYKTGAFLDEPRFMDMTRYSGHVTGTEIFGGGEASRAAVAGKPKAILIFEQTGAFAPPAASLALPGQPLRLSWQVQDNGDGTVTVLETSWWPDEAAFLAAWAGRKTVPGLRGLLAREEPVLWPKA